MQSSAPSVRKKIMIAAGGTGGHIFPAQSLAKEMLKKECEIEIAFIGGGLLKNPYFNRAFLFHDVLCGRLHKNNLFETIKSAFRILKGIFQSLRIIRKFKPHLIIGFGSYYSLPPLIAAKLLRVPIILHEANSVPGKVNRLLSRFVMMTGIHFPGAAHRLKGSTVEVGMPLREGYEKKKINKEDALKYYSLEIGKKTLLVFGGSQGAQAINKVIPEALYLKREEYQVIHITGNPESSSELKKLYLEKGVKAVVKDFENQMDNAWTAADMMISRAGAATIAEQIAFEVPGILIPYPHASDNHQDSNADYVCKEIGGAVKLSEKSLTVENLQKELGVVEKSYISLKENFSGYKKTSQKEDFSTLLVNLLRQM